MGSGPSQLLCVLILDFFAVLQLLWEPAQVHEQVLYLWWGCIVFVILPSLT